MNSTRADVDAVRGEHQRTPSYPLPSFLLSPFVCDEIGADKADVLTP